MFPCDSDLSGGRSLEIEVSLANFEQQTVKFGVVSLSESQLGVDGAPSSNEDHASVIFEDLAGNGANTLILLTQVVELDDLLLEQDRTLGDENVSLPLPSKIVTNEYDLIIRVVPK